MKSFNEERYGGIEEIPEKILEPGDPNYELYKCRKAFFTVIMGWTSILLQRGILEDAEAIQKAKDYLGFAKNEIAPRERITKGDIDRANEYLDYMIPHLQKIS